MKTTIIFRQGGNNSRIGNTFYWVENAKYWCEKHGFDFCFPLGERIFGDLFENAKEFFRLPDELEGSKIFTSDKEYSSFFGRIGQSVNSVEKKGKSEPRIFQVLPNTILHITAGSINWDEDCDFLETIKKHRYVIIEEPYPFKLTNSPSDMLKLNQKTISLLTEPRDDFVTVHVRQGDYKQWRNGEFYKDNQYYNDLIKKLILVTNETYRVAVVHNGEFSLDESLKDKVKDCPHHGYEAHLNDLLTLAMSRNVVGPYSTFSKLALDIRKRANLSSQNLVHFSSKSTIDEVLKKMHF